MITMYVVLNINIAITYSILVIPNPEPSSSNNRNTSTTNINSLILPTGCISLNNAMYSFILSILY